MFTATCLFWMVILSAVGEARISILVRGPPELNHWISVRFERFRTTENDIDYPFELDLELMEARSHSHLNYLSDLTRMVHEDTHVYAISLSIEESDVRNSCRKRQASPSTRRMTIATTFNVIAYTSEQDKQLVAQIRDLQLKSDKAEKDESIRQIAAANPSISFYTFNCIKQNATKNIKCVTHSTKTLLKFIDEARAIFWRINELAAQQFGIRYLRILNRNQLGNAATNTIINDEAEVESQNIRGCRSIHTAICADIHAPFDELQSKIIATVNLTRPKLHQSASTQNMTIDQQEQRLDQLHNHVIKITSMFLYWLTTPHHTEAKTRFLVGKSFKELKIDESQLVHYHNVILQIPKNIGNESKPVDNCNDPFIWRQRHDWMKDSKERQNYRDRKATEHIRAFTLLFILIAVFCCIFGISRCFVAKKDVSSLPFVRNHKEPINQNNSDLVSEIDGQIYLFEETSIDNMEAITMHSHKEDVLRYVTLSHSNLVRFYGVAAVLTPPKDEQTVFLIYDQISLLPLSHLLTRYKEVIDNNLQNSMISDLWSGVEFLHAHGITHGSINHKTAAVDHMFRLKLRSWINTEHWGGGGKDESNNETQADANKSNQASSAVREHEDGATSDGFRRLLFTDPQLIQSTIANEHQDQTMRNDVYSSAMLTYYICTKGQLPYSNLLSDAIKKGSSAATAQQIVIEQILLEGGDWLYQGAPVAHCVPLPNLQQILIKAASRQSFMRPPAAEVARQCDSQQHDNLVENMISRVSALSSSIAETRQTIDNERQRSESILFQSFPHKMAKSLLQGEIPEHRSYENAVVLFAHLMNFDRLIEAMTPAQACLLLSEIFHTYDRIIELIDVNRIDTIEDKYIAAAGIDEEAKEARLVKNEQNDDVTQTDAGKICEFALCLMAHAEHFNPRRHLQQSSEAAPSLEIRIGICCGPVVAGVIGFDSPKYVLLGDTVNTSSRMMSHSDVNQILTTENVVQSAPPNTFIFEARTPRRIKGKGFMQTFWLKGMHDETSIRQVEAMMKRSSSILTNPNA